MTELMNRNQLTRDYRLKIYQARADLSELQSLSRLISADTNLEATRRVMLLKQLNACMDVLLDNFQTQLDQL